MFHLIFVKLDLTFFINPLDPCSGYGDDLTGFYSVYDAVFKVMIHYGMSNIRDTYFKYIVTPNCGSELIFVLFFIFILILSTGNIT